jgi:glycine betaine/choline ABC-type transport system substrate-binding protein
MNMEYNTFGQFNSFGKSAMASAKELETINVKLVEKLSAKNMELFNSAVEINNKFVALLGQPAGLQDLMNEQLKLVGEYNGKMVTTIKEAADIVVESQDEYKTWLESGLKSVAQAAQEFSPMPKTAKKKAA